MKVALDLSIITPDGEYGIEIAGGKFIGKFERYVYRLDEIHDWINSKWGRVGNGYTRYEVAPGAPFTTADYERFVGDHWPHNFYKNKQWDHIFSDTESDSDDDSDPGCEDSIPCIIFHIIKTIRPTTSYTFSNILPGGYLFVFLGLAYQTEYQTEDAPLETKIYKLEKADITRKVAMRKTAMGVGFDPAEVVESYLPQPTAETGGRSKRRGGRRTNKRRRRRQTRRRKSRR